MSYTYVKNSPFDLKTIQIVKKKTDLYEDRIANVQPNPAQSS